MAITISVSDLKGDATPALRPDLMPTDKDARVRSVYQRVVAKTASFFGVPKRDVMRSRGERQSDAISRARQLAVYLTVTAFDCSGRSVGRVAGLTPEGVRYTCNTVEDLRDDRKFDVLLDLFAEELTSC